MIRTIDVQIGQVRVAEGAGLLRATALGSCVAVCLYDPRLRLGAMAHVMLPGSAPSSTPADRCGRYAGEALATMMACMTDRGSRAQELHATLVGAGNVLHKDDDRICGQNIVSTITLLTEMGVMLRGHRLGGYVRRSAELEVGSGRFYYTEAGGPRRLLWAANEHGGSGTSGETAGNNPQDVAGAAPEWQEAS